MNMYIGFQCQTSHANNSRSRRNTSLPYANPCYESFRSSPTSADRHKAAKEGMKETHTSDVPYSLSWPLHGAMNNGPNMLSNIIFKT